MRKFTLTFLLSAFILSGFAQNFTKFEVSDGSSKKGLHGLAHRTGAAIIDILVPEDFDLTTVAIEYELDLNVELITNPLPTDFSSPQTISTKNTETEATKNWTVTLKKVRKAPLPLALDFSSTDLNIADWNKDVIGWAPAAIDGGQASVIRYGNLTATFITAFENAPEQAVYSLNVVGAANEFGDALFVVSTSADGETWTAIRTFDKDHPILNEKTQYTDNLASDVRYIKWVYITRVNNVNLNNITITKKEETGVLTSEEQMNQIYFTGNRLRVSNPELVKEISLYSITGSLIMRTENPAAITNIENVTNGLYMAKVKYNTGNETVVKLLNK